ncbi:hypothetical protein Tco_1318975 [Tanacetum coccineum]
MDSKKAEMDEQRVRMDSKQAVMDKVKNFQQKADMLYLLETGEPPVSTRPASTQSIRSGKVAAEPLESTRSASTQSIRSGKEAAEQLESTTSASTQSIRSGKVAAEPANPQSFAYFMFLYAMAGIVTFELGAVRPLLRQNPSLFKDHGGVFTIMTIVSGSMAVLASVILILASLLLQSWMKDIHYTILKAIGSFSAIFVPFSLGAVVFVPSGDLNWITYTVLGVIFGGFLYLYSCVWKVACAYHQEKHFNSYPVHWSLLLALLLPILSNFVFVFRGNTHWALQSLQPED